MSDDPSRPRASHHPAAGSDAAAAGAAALLALALIVLFAAFALTRLALAPGLGADDAKETVFTQSLAWGYDPRQPPLYTWMLWVVHRVMGVGLAGSLLLKYLLLVVALVVFYFAARRALHDDKYAVMAAGSLLLFPPIGLMAHEIFTHTLPLMVACAVSFLVFLRLADDGRTRDFALFGAAVGLGLLSKYGFAAFLACLIVAGLLQPGFRRRIVSPKMGLAAAVAGIVVFPHAAWLATADIGVIEVFTATMTQGGDRLGSVMHGLWRVVVSIAQLVFPLVLPAVLLFPAILRPRADGQAPPAGETDPERLVRDMLILALAGMLAAVLLAGVDQDQARWLHPVLLVLPILVFARIRRTVPPPWRMWAMVTLLLLVPMGFFVWRTLELTLGPPICAEPCLDRAPFKPVIALAAAAGFTGGTIIAGDIYTAGNMRAGFPRARVRWALGPAYDPPAVSDGGQCLIVWRPDADAAVPPAALRLAGLAGAVPRPRVARLPWHLPFRGGGDRVTVWAFVLIEGGSETCR